MVASIAHAGGLSLTAKTEIDALLSRLESSDCHFFRNGSRYTGPEAKNHLQAKLDDLVKKGRITNSEEFIARAATTSSVSGQPYGVQCANQTEQPCAVWLVDELRRFREAHGG